MEAVARSFREPLAVAAVAGWALFGAGPPEALAQRGDIQVHDPVMIQEGNTYYIFSTGAGVPIRRSTNMVDWEMIGRVLADFPDELPPWAPDAVPGVRRPWAPDVSYFNGRFHVYYSLSTFGRNTSAIGLATNVTLDPERPDYEWVDRGKVVQSTPEDHWNAIDPNVAFDDEGEPWLSWGSFWRGIRMRKLDASTGMPSDEDERLYSLAARPYQRAVEAPHILRHGDYYYLFVSFDRCCRGEESTYRIVVGRSREITGPYVDNYDIPMMLGGATPVLSGDGRVRGPGHNGIFVEGDRQYLVHHYYDAEDDGESKLQIRPIVWSRDGWPFPGDPLTEPE